MLVDFGPSKGRVNLNVKTQIVTVGEFDQRQKQKKVDQEKATRRLLRLF